MWGHRLIKLNTEHSVKNSLLWGFKICDLALNVTYPAHLGKWSKAIGVGTGTALKRRGGEKGVWLGVSPRKILTLCDEVLKGEAGEGRQSCGTACGKMTR